MKGRGQSSLEYLLLIGGAVLVAVVVLLLLASDVLPAGNGIIGNNLGAYGNIGLNSASGGPGGGPVCPNNVCESGEDNFTCPQDCPSVDVCGDGTVSGTETCDTLGNVLCSTGETCTACFSCDPTPPVGGENVLIVRDTRGVAHIFSPSDEGAFYGMGYAAAEDRILQMEYIRMYMQGRLSELIGLRTCIDPDTGIPCGDSVQNDTKLRLMLFDEYAQKRELNLDPETRAFLAAYASGVNQYVADHPVNTLSQFDSSHVFEPWQPYHSLLAWDFMVHPTIPTDEIDVLHQFDALVGGGMTPLAAATQIAGGLPKNYVDDTAATVEQSDFSSAELQAIQNYANAHPPYGGLTPAYIPTPHFSHGWAVSGAKTTTGNSVLVGDPKLTVHAPSYWVESHIVGATINARGVTIPGAIGYFVGFNEHVAWTQTASAGDYTDLFRITPGTGSNGGTFWYNGAYVPWVASNEQIIVKGGSPIPITTVDTQLGPLVTGVAPNAYSNEEYVLTTIPQWDSGTHTTQSLIAMMRAGNVNQFFNALDKWATPAVNTIFADDAGSVGYAHSSALPTRSSLSPLAGYMAQDGTSSNYAWQGLLSHTLRPHVINPSKGYVFSGNNLPVGSWYPIRNGTQFAGGDTQRSARVRELLTTAAAAGNMTPTQIFDMHYDTEMVPLRILVEAADHVKTVQEPIQGALLTTNTNNALPYLNIWHANGSRLETGQPYFSLANFMGTTFRNNTVLSRTYGGGDGGLMAFLKNLDYNLSNVSGYLLSSDEIAYVNYSIGTAWTSAVGRYGSNPATWDAAATASTLTQLNAPYFSLLFQDYGCFFPSCASTNRSYRPIPSFSGNTLWSQKGQIYTQFVDFSIADGTQSISPAGVSEDPTSPHFDDQSDEWLAGTLFPAPLSSAALAPIVESTETIQYISP